MKKFSKTSNFVHIFHKRSLWVLLVTWQILIHYQICPKSYHYLWSWLLLLLKVTICLNFSGIGITKTLPSYITSHSQTQGCQIKSLWLPGYHFNLDQLKQSWCIRYNLTIKHGCTILLKKTPCSYIGVILKLNIFIACSGEVS